MPVVAVGTGKLKVGGVQYMLADELRIMAASEKREAIVGLDGTVAIQRTFQSPWVEASLRDDPAIDLQDVYAQENVTVTVELTNGSSYELSNAYYTGDAELDARDGKVAARWNGATMRRIV